LSRGILALPSRLNLRLKDVSKSTTSWGCILILKSETSVPPHFAKISEIKNISKPPLAIELYTICPNVSFNDFRKEAIPFCGS
jgi:hypothetical protein